MMTIEIPLDELRQIEENYMRGQYAHLADCLRQFLINHSLNILKLKEEEERKSGKPTPLDSIVGLYILKNKNVVSFKRDMQDQKKEIENTIWYEHEKGRHISALEIEIEWGKRYAEGWRTHRTREIMYVFSRNRQEYLELVK
jgi:hypothetical protein